MQYDLKAIRQFFLNSLQKANQGETLSPIETILVHILHAHPEYHDVLQDEDGLTRQFSLHPYDNPFIHLSLHLSLSELLQTDRPAGIRALFHESQSQFENLHLLEHVFLEQLFSVLLASQQAGALPDEHMLLNRLREVLHRRGRVQNDHIGCERASETHQT